MTEAHQTMSGKIGKSCWEFSQPLENHYTIEMGGFIVSIGLKSLVWTEY